MKKRNRITAAVLSLCLLFTTGCFHSNIQPEETAVDITAEVKEPTPSENAEMIPDGASLVSLRQTMVGTPQLFAVAYFGRPDIVDPDIAVDPYAVMQKQAPDLCRDLPFLLEIPENRVIGNNGDLFCIVPLDADATVLVSRGTWDENGQFVFEDSPYFGESGEPILLFCNPTGVEPDTQLYISGPSGEVLWYPQIDDKHYAMPLRNDNWDDLFMDFSSYRELLMKRHRDLKDSAWIIPTAQALAGTTWVLDGFFKDGHETSYRLRFDENILSIRWNDGIDEQDHEYLYAPWELTCDEDLAILSIDFGEFAGVLRYNLLYHDYFELLYVAMDTTQEDIPIGWEPLYQYLMKPVAPEPTEMIGTWELAWTEVEDDRKEAEPGACTIEIGSTAAAGLMICYTSREHPDNNFYDEPLTIEKRELYILCGNDEWVANLDYVGPWGTTYAVTLTADDTLIKQNYFLLDGAPTVSFEYFRRVAE